MGEKRKARMSNNERKSKKEKKPSNTVTPTASSEDIEEKTSIHSNGSSTVDSINQEPSTTKENTNPEELDESQTIPPIDGEEETNENHVESISSTNDDNPKIINESIPTPKSWWSSLFRLFHFRNNTNENKAQLNNSTDNQNGSYLSNVKPRRSLHDQSLVN